MRRGPWRSPIQTWKAGWWGQLVLSGIISVSEGEEVLEMMVVRLHDSVKVTLNPRMGGHVGATADPPPRPPLSREEQQGLLRVSASGGAQTGPLQWGRVHVPPAATG